VKLPAVGGCELPDSTGSVLSGASGDIATELPVGPGLERVAGSALCVVGPTYVCVHGD
jgi:hypothetical protein